MDVVITSEHRVGSRWMHYLFADILGKRTSPELDSKKLYEEEYRKEIIRRFKENKIVKLHHATPNQVIQGVRIAAKENGYNLDLKVLGLVRNPRDQGVSLCFHNRYHKNRGVFKEQEFETDEEALRYTILESPHYRREMYRQFNYMIDGHSTNYYELYYGENEHFSYFPYIWTTYENLKSDTVLEVLSIVKFFTNNSFSLQKVLEYVNAHSFENRSGRKTGTEKRNDLWRRKGIVGDWENHFDSQMVTSTQFLYDMFVKTYNKNFNL